MQRTRVEETFYTHALWRVKPGNEQAFIAAWRAMGEAFLAIPGTKTHGTLIQSLTDPTLFYSFGPWQSLEEIQTMRADATSQAALAKARELCEEVVTGAYKLAASVGG